MTTAVRHFLLTFDHATATLVHCDEFDDQEAAVRAYDEQEAVAAPSLEIVLLSADSIETVRATHGRYFAATGTAAFRALSSL